MKGKLIMTVEQAQDRKAWETLRNSGIGGSDAAVIVGVNPWKSRYQLWAEKTGKIEPEDLSDNEPVYWGNVFEQAVADRFAELTGKKVRKCGTLQDEEHAFMLANVDRLVVGENAGLECKTANGFKAKEWEGEEVPAAYLIQCQWYMMVTGAEKWYIACLIGGQKFVWKEVPRNESDIESLRSMAIDFWQNYVLADVAPEVDGSESCTETLNQQYSESNAESVYLPSQAANLIARLDELKATEKLLKTEKEAAENGLKLLLGSAEVGLFNDRKVSWISRKGSVTIDTKRLQAEQPQIFEQYKKVGKASRAFKLS